MKSSRSSLASVTTKICSLALLVGATLLAACSSSSSGGGGSDTPAQCHKLCDVEAQAAKCPASTKTDPLCGQLCDAIVPGFSDACKPKADAYYGCAQKLSYECGTGSNFPHQTDPNACEAELKAYNEACFQKK